MAAIQNVISFFTSQNLGSRISWLAAVLWCFALPFAQIQHTRFTSIFLFSILGGFLISILRNGFSIYKVPFRNFKQCLPFIFLAILPLIHGFDSEANAKEIVLRAPLFIIPFVLLYQAVSWHSRTKVILMVTFLLSYCICNAVLFSWGIEEVYCFVRSELETGPLFLISRPYFGICAGIVFFGISGLLFPDSKSIGLDFGLFLPVAALLFIILAKISLIAFCISFAVYLFLKYRKRPVFLLSFVFISGLILAVGTFKVVQSSAFKDAVTLGGINYSSLPKVYSNSINNRLILWRASFQLLKEGSHGLTGYSPEELQTALDKKVSQYNGYLTNWHLNPHNQLLYMVLKYGLFGLAVFIFLWSSLLFGNKPIWTGAWFFIFICSFTEVYLDREMGVQLFILTFFLSRNTNKTGYFG